MCLMVAFIFMFLITFLICRLRKRDARKYTTVVVMGDIGRSPRMQYHALSLAKQNYFVTVIGYGGSKPHADIQNNSNIYLHYVMPCPAFLSGLPRTLLYLLKAAWQGLTLFVALLFSPRPDHVLIQNPPGLPGLAVCWIACKLRGSGFVIDWHNYGYTILAMGAGDNHPFVKFSKWFEKSFGLRAGANICVTDAMRKDLKEAWGISAVTMYDRPPTMFQETSLSEQHKLFSHLSEKYCEFKSIEEEPRYNTAFTSMTLAKEATKRKDRPALVVSSTSWTEDEDFTLLLDALEDYEELMHSGDTTDLPCILCVITGKGPQKSHYQEIISRKKWSFISVCTPWLEAEDYPKLLGSADLGVSLHMSSSGLDLPMKVVDMFGCCLPVCAVNFRCLHELVHHDHNGMVFHDSKELSQQLQCLLKGFPGKCEKLQHFRHNLKAFQNVRWDETWNLAVLPLLTQYS